MNFRNNKKLRFLVYLLILALVLGIHFYRSRQELQQAVASAQEGEVAAVVPQGSGGQEASSGAPQSGGQEASQSAEGQGGQNDAQQEDPALAEDGSYTSKEDVALYLHLYGHLPGNFITKKQAEDLGWSGGSLERYAPGKCIGGSKFGNYEGLLPEAKGRQYYECDIDTLGAKSRGAKRIVYSSDGLIYYTGDHYESFELLYGEE